MNWYRLAQQSSYNKRWDKTPDGFAEDTYTQIGHSDDSISWLWDGQNFQSFKGKSHMFYDAAGKAGFAQTVWRGWYEPDTGIISVIPPVGRSHLFQSLIGKDVKIPPFLERMLDRKFSPIDIKVFV